MRTITFQESVQLVQEILSQPPGNWTHLLKGKPVREVERCIVSSHGFEIVFFRAEDYCGRWNADQFDKYAVPYVPPPEQLEMQF